MKRPFAVVGITYLIAQTLAVLCGFAVTAALFCMALLCVLSLFLLVKQRPAWLLPMAISCAVCFGANVAGGLVSVKPTEVLQGQELYITGRVCEVPVNSYGRYSYIIETDSVSLTTAPQEVKLRLSSQNDINARYGDIIKTTVIFNYTDATSADMRDLLADGVTLTAYLPYNAKPYVTESDTSLIGWIYDLRAKFSQAAVELMGERMGGLLVGMFTGDTSGVETDTLSAFRDCGLSHIFAVSGLHLSVFVAVLTILFRRVTPDYRKTSLMTIPFVLFFMAFAGFSMSIIRAGIMTLISLTAKVVRRESDALNSLGIAALLICASNPFAAGDIGMLLSFASTFGLITLSWPTEKRIRFLVKFDPKSRYAFILRPLIGTITASIVAAVCTFPISVLCFGEMSLISPLANALTIYPAAIFMVIGALAAVVYTVPLIGAVLGFILYLPVWVAGQLTTALVSILSRAPGAGMAMNYPFMAVFLIIAAGITLLWFIQFGRSKERSYSLFMTIALVVQIFMIGTTVYNSANLMRNTIIAFDTDGGVMTALVSGGRCVIVGAGGGGYNMWLASQKLADGNLNEVAAVVLPDNSDRCAGNADEIIKQYHPEYVLLAQEGRRYEMIERTCRESETHMYNIEDAELSLPGCGIYVRAFTDENDMLWVWADCDGLTMLVCPENGDCSLVPDEYDAPDIALITSDDIVNITHIHPIATVLSDDDGKAESVLAYRGIKDIFTIADDGCIMVSESGEGICLDPQ